MLLHIVMLRMNAHLLHWHLLDSLHGHLDQLLHNLLHRHLFDILHRNLHKLLHHLKQCDRGRSQLSNKLGIERRHNEGYSAYCQMIVGPAPTHALAISGEVVPSEIRFLSERHGTTNAFLCLYIGAFCFFIPQKRNQPPTKRNTETHQRNGQ